MSTFLRPIAVAATVTLMALAATPLRAQSFNDKQRSEIETVIRDYLLKHPEVLQEAIAELEKRQAVAEADKARVAVKNHSEVLFNSTRQVTLGNPQGDVTFVEFFDYNCGYCKRALSDMMTLMDKDPKLKIVLKEYPVLGPGSLEAAQVAVAVRMQAPGKKYLEFHQKLLLGRGQVDRAKALAAARDVGIDMVRLERDLKSDEVAKTIDETRTLGEALGLNGTPSYVIGDTVIIGAVGLAALAEKVEAARRQ